MTSGSAAETGATDHLVRQAADLGNSAWDHRWAPTRAFFAPGRIELLGNHLDYNGGKVLAGAIDRGIVAVADEAGESGRIQVAFIDPHGDDRSVDDLDVASLPDWSRDSPPDTPTDYVRGAVAAIMALGLEPRSGLRLAYSGDLPVGLGLSSSAALCVSTVAQLLPHPVDRRDWILLAQAAENRAGVSCGTMDQAASIAGGVIRYDAAAIGIEELTPDLGWRVFIVVSSGVVHRLGESAYPVRVREMARLHGIAREHLGEDAPASIADITSEQVERLAAAHALDDTLRSRVRHLISESARVEEGYDALARQDWVAFGKAMTASGRSSATDYDVSHPQVEELVALLNGQPGILGARMMGGGGGGSVLALAKRDAIDAIRATVDGRYFEPHGLSHLPDRLLVCQSGPGAHEVPFTNG
ncbi:MAG TPA: galactokinase family protein [Thermomicrobiales bacterium]|jgi:galactokinase|nr:galactokinase family protein [Thermomicrobiales bacterium]